MNYQVGAPTGEKVNEKTENEANNKFSGIGCLIGIFIAIGIFFISYKLTVMIMQ